MSRYRYGIAAFVVAASLAVAPRDAAAGMVDVIIEMSGPQLWGPAFRCRFSVSGGLGECHVAGYPVNKKEDPAWTERVWFTADAGFYFSTGDNGQIPFEAWTTRMFAFEPMVEFRSTPVSPTATADNRGVVYHGVGLTLDYLFGDTELGEDFEFGKVGIKLRPIAVAYGRHWEIAYNIRLYPSGFTADQFGVGPRLDRPFEVVHGITAGWKY